MTTKWPKRPTQARADQFYYETASTGSPIDDQLVQDFLAWGGWGPEHAGRARAVLTEQQPRPDSEADLATRLARLASLD